MYIPLLLALLVVLFTYNRFWCKFPSIALYVLSIWFWFFAAQTLLEVVESQDNVHLASDFDSLPQDSTHDLLLEDVLEEDEELLDNHQENGEGAEAIGDDTTDLDLSATGTTKNFKINVISVVNIKNKHVLNNNYGIICTT